MRIGIDVKSLAKRHTGIAIYVKEMIRFFNEFDHEDDFYLYSHKDFDLDFNLGDNFHKVVFKSIAGSIGVIFYKKMYEKYQLDVFWGTEHCIPWGKRSFKRVLTIHDLAVLHHPEVGTRYNSLLQKFQMKPSCHQADRIIAISKSTALDIINTTGVPLDRIEVIYNGDSPYTNKEKKYSKNDHYLFREKLHIGNSRYFLFVGSIEPRKNISTIIKGYEQYRRFGGKCKLVLAGGLGWRYKGFLEQIKRSEYHNDIVLTGYVSNEEKEYLYRNMQSLVFPSLWEGFGLPIVEAMSVGKPVITSNISSLPEVGGDVAFYLNDIYNFMDLAKLMVKVENLSDLELKSICIRGMRASSLFSRKECAKKTLSLLKSVCTFPTVL